MSDLATLTHYKLSIEEYHKLAEVGILNEDSRVELIEGELIEMSPIGPPHSWMINKLNRLLVNQVDTQAVVSVQNSLRLPPNSEPQPDLVLLREHMANIRTRIAGPDDVLLVIEVADSSLAYDRGIKQRLYAKTRIPAFWIVNVSEENIESYQGAEGTGYREKLLYRKGDVLTFSEIPSLKIDVEDLFR